MKEKKLKIMRSISLIIIIIFLGYLTLQLLPIFEKISTEAGRIEVKTTVESLGLKGALMIIGLMVSQILLPILPGEPVEILSGMCFGIVGGMLIAMLGAFISAAIIFFAVRKFGKSFIYTFVSKEKIDKIENSKIFADKTRLNFIIFILFFIPGTPKDLFVYIAGLLPVNPLKFLIISSVARFPSIISSTIAGSNLLDGNWNLIIATYTITFGLTAILIWAFSRKRNSILKQL